MLLGGGLFKNPDLRLLVGGFCSSFAEDFLLLLVELAAFFCAAAEELLLPVSFCFIVPTKGMPAILCLVES